MNEWEVLISEHVTYTYGDYEWTEIERSVRWVGMAGSERDARGTAWEAWDQKYGKGTRPADPTITVKPIAARSGNWS